MSAPPQYPAELKEHATRLAVEARQDPATRTAAFKRIGDQLGIHPEALRTWVRDSEVDEGLRPGTPSAESTRIAQLERENREMRRANTILKQASAFFASMSRYRCRRGWLVSSLLRLPGRWLLRGVPPRRRRRPGPRHGLIGSLRG